MPIAPSPSPTTPAPARSTDPAALVRRISRLRAALEAASRDNAHLQRELAIARAENRRLREQLSVQTEHRPHAEPRRLMSAPWSRNP